MLWKRVTKIIWVCNYVGIIITVFNLLPVILIGFLVWQFCWTIFVTHAQHFAFTIAQTQWIMDRFLFRIQMGCTVFGVVYRHLHAIRCQSNTLDEKHFVPSHHVPNSKQLCNPTYVHVGSKVYLPTNKSNKLSLWQLDRISTQNLVLLFHFMEHIGKGIYFVLNCCLYHCSSSHWRLRHLPKVKNILGIQLGILKKCIIQTNICVINTKLGTIEFNQSIPKPPR